MAVTRVTEKKLIRVDQNAGGYENPSMLIWKDRHGEKVHWLFNGYLKRQSLITSKSKTVNSVSTNSTNPYDLEYIKAFERVLRKESVEAFELYAPEVMDYYHTDDDLGEVLLSERETLQSLAESNKVYMLINPTTWDTTENSIPVGAKVIEVDVDGNSFDFGHKGEGHFTFSCRVISQPNQTLRG